MPRPALTVKQRRLVQAMQTASNQTEAGIAAGYRGSRKTIRESVSRDLAKPRVQSELIKLMNKKGLTDERLLDVLEDGLEAKKVISAVIVGKDADEKTNDFIDVEDHPTRHKFLVTALELRKHLKNDEPSASRPTVINIVHAYRPHGTEHRVSAVRPESIGPAEPGASNTT